MGMWPTATLTFGYDFELPDADWANGDDPDWHGCNLLKTEGIPGHVGVHRDDSDAHGGYRLTAAFLQACGWTDKGTADSLELPDAWESSLRYAAAVLGIDLGDAKPYWLLTGEYS